MVEVAIAIDVGGTDIKAGLLDSAGQLVHLRRAPTERERGAQSVISALLDAATKELEVARSRGDTPVTCGVAVPGVVDESAGVLMFSANLGLRDVALRDAVQERIGLPTSFGHDVRAAALAEVRLGAGRGSRRTLFLALGTGISGAFALDGRIDPGTHGASGEIGHVVIRTGTDALPCGCGGRGCLERYASASAVADAYARSVGIVRMLRPGSHTADGTAGRSPGTDEQDRAAAPVRPGEPDPTVETFRMQPRSVQASSVDAAEVVRRAEAGEERAQTVWQEAVVALADGLLVGIALHDPERVVLGGGLGRAGDALLEPLAKALVQRRTFHRLPDVVTARLGDKAGCHGAGLLAFDMLAGTNA